MRTKAEEVALGLMTLSKYEDCHVAADHDVIFAGPCKPEAVSDYHKTLMKELNWIYSESDDCWIIYV